MLISRASGRNLRPWRRTHQSIRMSATEPLKRCCRAQERQCDHRDPRLLFRNPRWPQPCIQVCGAANKEARAVREHFLVAVPNRIQFLLPLVLLLMITQVESRPDVGDICVHTQLVMHCCRVRHNTAAVRTRRQIHSCPRRISTLYADRRQVPVQTQMCLFGHLCMTSFRFPALVKPRPPSPLPLPIAVCLEVLAISFCCSACTVCFEDSRIWVL